MSPTVTVRVSDQAGNETTATKSFSLGTGTVPISGNISGLLGDAHIVGDLNLTGDVFSEGRLTGVDTFHVQGNGFSWFFQNGGRGDLHGKVKARWGEWGTDTTGWLPGDRLAIAPTALGMYVPSGLVWSDWSMPRPVNSPDVTLVDGSVRKPEVVNLSQSIVFENLARGFHFHNSAGIQTLSDVKFLNCGTLGVLGNYPCHFHLLYDNSRGSVLTRVVVEGGKNHAFVPHGSHGITQTGCVAYNTTGPAYWWDPPPDQLPGENEPNPINDSEDIVWDDCLALWVKSSPGGVGSARTTGFSLGAGQRLSCQRSVAACVQGTTSVSSQRSGFHWPEGTSRSSWDFRDCVGHNNVNSGLLVWQNARSIENVLEDFVGYHNQRADIEHGSYVNRYQYRGAVLTGGGFMLHAKSAPEGPLNIEDILSDAALVVTKHNSSLTHPTFFRRCTFPQVIYDEPSNGSVIVYEDCGLTPSDFDLGGIAAESIIEIKKGGVLTHRWAVGMWT